MRGLEKRFGNMVALTALDLDLPAGSLFSLLGPSGCGKTTLMRIIAGLEQPDGGAVILDGEDITGAPPERRPFNMVFQRYALFPHLTVFDNLAFGLTTDRAHRAEPHKIAARVNDCLRLVGLDGLEKRYPSQLSGGQQQRVALGRAIVRRPRALLLDERCPPSIATCASRCERSSCASIASLGRHFSWSPTTRRRHCLYPTEWR